MRKLLKRDQPRGGRSRLRRFSFLAPLCLIFGMMSAGVTSYDEQTIPDRSVKASLDYERVRIQFPIDDYRVSSEDGNMIARAFNTALRSCLESKGYPKREQSAGGMPEHRNFGIWSVERAKQYGFSIPGLKEDPVTPPGSVPSISEAEMQASTECRAEKPEIQEFASFTGFFQVSGEINTKSYNDARKNPEWSKAREDFWQCLSSYGLTPRKGDGEWGSAQDREAMSQRTNNPGDLTAKEKEIEIAVIEATCNQESRLTQRLADLQASYQAPLIKKNEAILNQEKAQGQEIVIKAREYLATQQ